jgi:hypothetical protein
MRRSWWSRSGFAIVLVLASMALRLPTSLAANLPCSSTTSIGFGAAPLTGVISNPAEAACFTFSAVSGDEVFVNDVGLSGGVAPETDIFDPGGISKCATPGLISQCAIDSTGVWTIQISDVFLSHTGTFNVFAQRTDSPVGCQALSFGTLPRTGTVRAPSDAACFTFSGNSGDVIFAHAVTTSGTLFASPGLRSFDTLGKALCTTEGDLFCTLTGTGTQTILAYDDGSGLNTGNFHLSIQRLNNPSGCAALKFAAAPISKTISSVGQVACFTFSGVTGDRVSESAVVTSGTFSPEVDLFTPAGLSECANPGQLTDCTLPSGGTWTTLVDGPGTGAFTMAAVDLDVNPQAGGQATSVSLTGGGFTSGEPVHMLYRTGLTSPASVLICKTTAAADGTATCSGPIPSGANAGATGAHVIQGAGATSHHSDLGRFTLS